MNDKELKELQDIKKLLVAQLLVAGVQVSEIEEILNLGDRNFAKSYKAKKLVKRLKENERE